MILTNLSDAGSLTLPDDLLWADEHAWSAAVTTTDYLLTGALLIQSAARLAGRPITLVGAADMAWVTRATVETLWSWAAAPVSAESGRLRLTLADGRVFNVCFRHADTAIDAAPVLGLPARGAGDFYRLTVRLMVI